jgi:hypothetical protein
MLDLPFVMLVTPAQQVMIRSKAVMTKMFL